MGHMTLRLLLLYIEVTHCASETYYATRIYESPKDIQKPKLPTKREKHSHITATTDHEPSKTTGLAEYTAEAYTTGLR